MGAGPAGLAVAAELRQQGHQPVVLEQAVSVGSSWSGRWDGLRLHTMRSLSHLPGAPIPRRYGRWVSKDDFAAYLRDYADRFSISVELGVTVERIERADPGWQVLTSRAGKAHARHDDAVVVATGYSRQPYVPDWPGRERFGRRLLHSTGYRSAGEFAGHRVLVVGAGNSAAEIAAELVEGGAQVQLSVRTPPNIVRRATLGVPSQLVGLALRRAPEAVLNPLSGLLRRVSVPDLTAHGLPAPADGFTQFLRTRTVPVLDHGFVEHVRGGRIGVVAAVVALTEDAVELADGSSVTVDSVVCCTGFTPALEPLVGRLGVLGEDGLPLVHGGQTLPAAPRLHFVGITVELSGLLHEIGREALEVARALS